jgi:hypothetical protein
MFRVIIIIHRCAPQPSGVGLAKVLPPIVFIHVAFYVCPGLGLLHVLLVWVSTTKKPWNQQDPP